jgi:hypothetical protein
MTNHKPYMIIDVKTIPIMKQIANSSDSKVVSLGSSVIYITSITILVLMIFIIIACNFVLR